MQSLKFGEITRIADVRKLYDMKGVIYDKKWLKSQQNFELYYMYRDLYKNESDYNIIKKNGLRYDITVIPSKLFGCEFIKTAGHYHPNINKSNLSYTEVYQVLEGKATYLLQKLKSKDSVLDFIVIRAKKGDSIIIPPNYGHVTVNESDIVLKMANWLCRDFSSEYDLIKEMKGMAYFLTTGGFIKNLKYKEVCQLRYIKPTNFFKGNMYSLVNDVDKLKFLTNPETLNI